MRSLRNLTFVTLLAVAGAASAQTAGGPDRASPGAMPSETPLTTGGAPRTTATPASIGANKPARPRRVRRPTVPRSSKAVTTDAPATSQ